MNNLKRFLICLAAILPFAVSGFAGVKWMSGDVKEFFGAKIIPVYLDYSNAVFAGYGDIGDFMLMADRDSDWEIKNREEFNYHANDVIGEQGYGFRFVMPEKVLSPKYFVKIVITDIERNGHIHGVIELIDAKTELISVTFSFKSDDADATDDDMFKDQMESIGESFGKTLKKCMKNAIKQGK